MPHQPDFFAPTRDEGLPDGSPAGDVDGNLTLGFTWEPTIGPQETNYAVTGWYQIRDFTFHKGKLYGIGANGNIFRMTTAGVIEIDNDPTSFPTFHGITSDGTQLITIVTRLGSSSVRRVVRWSDDLSTATEIRALTGDHQNIQPVGTNWWLSRFVFDAFLVQVGDTPNMVRTGDSAAVDDTHLYNFADNSGTKVVTSYPLATGVRDTTGEFPVPNAARGVAKDGKYFYVQTSTTQLRRVVREPHTFVSWQMRRSTDGGTTWAYWRHDRLENSPATQWDSTIGEGDTAGHAAASLLTRAGGTPLNERWAYTFDENWNDGTGTHIFQVRTLDSAGTWSVWSASQTVIPSTTTTVTISTPANDGDDIDANYNPSWSVGTPQAYYRVLASAGLASQDSGLQTSSATTHNWGNTGDNKPLTELDELPDDGTELVITVSVWNALTLSSIGTRRARVRYPKPLAPETVSASAGSDGSFVRVEWIAKAKTGSTNADTARIEVWRRVNGGTPQRVYIDTSPLNRGTTGDPPPFVDTAGRFDDYWAPLEQTIEYSVRPFGAQKQGLASDVWVS